MRLACFKLILLMGTLVFSSPIPVIAQDPPAETYQPGFWQPTARFNPKMPVEIQLINKTDITLEYDFTNVETINPSSIDPGKTGILKDFGNSAYVVVYSKSTPDPDATFTLKFDVKVTDNNLVTITIERANPSFFGHRAINLQKTGGIFLY